MKEMPILITYERWSNCQLSIARHTGGMEINGKNYFLVAEHSNVETPDLLREDWIPVYERLGRDRTIRLIENGTTLNVAKQMINAMDVRQKRIKLGL